MIVLEDCKCENIKYARRFYPHISKGEGQFMAVLRNCNTASEVYKSENSIKKAERQVLDFLDEVLKDYKKENVRMYKGNPVYFTPNFEVAEGTAFSCGITIGEIRKNYIQPHHQFFMGLGKNFKRKIELEAESEMLERYLHGEEFETDCVNGWAVVTVNGCTLGGVKVVNGRAKNHYPKGLRKT